MRKDISLDDQHLIWNGTAGQAWVDLQQTLDRMLQPMQDALVEAVWNESARQVLEVGCGTGGVTLAVQRLLGSQGRCVGMDISEPMLALARERAALDGAKAQFVCSNVESEAPDASFDAIISRFGVMFFNDPVLAFSNLRRAIRPGGGLHFLAWRSGAENPFMTTAERAAAPLLPALPAREEDAPGQFAFADRNRVTAILADSGWANVEIRPVDYQCSLQTSELELYFTRMGPLGRVLPTVDPSTREKVVTAMREAFGTYVHGQEVRFTAACWMVSARTL